MDKYIGAKYESLPSVMFAKNDPHYLRLAKLDAMLDGEFYDGLPYSFYQETTGGEGSAGTYVPVRDRRPSFQFNLYSMLANQVSRKLFAGSHAPALVHKKQSTREKFDALKEECQLEAVMLEAIYWGSIGSVCTVFQIVPYTHAGQAKSKVVAKNYRAKQCSPTFNKLDELSRVLIHYLIQGVDCINAEVPVLTDFEDKEIEGEKSYWFIMQLDSEAEVQFKPIPVDKWSPVKGKTKDLIEMEDTEVKHGLGFVPAHWHQFRTGKLKPYDGICYWEPAKHNIIDLDYTISQIGAGVRYNAVPQVVVKGVVVNPTNDGGLGRGASRFIQIKHDIKEGDTEEKNADVKMLEATGNGMSVGLEHWAPFCLRMALQQVTASMKDPKQMTTAMSGKGLELLEAEFLDLCLEIRSLFGDNGYLKLLKKIALACQLKKHVLMAGVNQQEIDGLTLAWPPLTGIGMLEFGAMAQGLAVLVENQILDKKVANEWGCAQIDMPVHSANKDYLSTIETPVESDDEIAELDEEKDPGDEIEKALAPLAAAGVVKAEGAPINTRTRIPGVQ